MKRVLFTTVAFCLIDAVLATTCHIKVQKDRNDTNVVKINCDLGTTRLASGEAVSFGDIGTGLWNGTSFSMSKGNLSADDIEISSTDIPVILDSFLSPQCEVSSPGLTISGNTQITGLTAELLGMENEVLDVSGKLITKNFDIYGSTEINGEVLLQQGGALRVKNYLGNSSITVNGQLSSFGDLQIDTGKNFMAKVVNNGVISSGTDVISCSTNEFINEATGRMYGEEVSFCTRNFENYGVLEFINLNLSLQRGLGSSVKYRMNPFHFIQKGVFIVHEEATMDFNLKSSGNTYIKHLVFPNISNVNVSGGETLISRISGKTNIIESKNGAILQIEDLEEGADYVKSLGKCSKLIIENFSSDGKPKISAESGGEVIIGDAQAIESFIHSKDGNLNIANLKGKSSALISGTAVLQASGTTDLTLVAEEDAETKIADSFVKEMYALGRSSNVLSNAEVSNLRTNKATVRAESTKIKYAENNNEMSFVGNTKTEKLSNNGVVTFENGEHNIENYVGRSSNATIKVESKDQITDQTKTLGSNKEKESDDTVVKAGALDKLSNEVKKLIDFDKSKKAILQSGSSLVTIDNMNGAGDIDAFRQVYNKKLPTMFHTVGNVAAVLDYMPDPHELPEHDSGDFLILANMQTDYINTSDVNYEDALIFMQMNGHKWENKNANFIAGGLRVNDTPSWGNTEGFIGLERLLSVKAGMIYNVSNPIARENGRWVDDWSNWRARLIYYCPATYYSANPNNGIAVIDGDIRLKSNGDIVNRFSSIYTSGKLEAVANSKFENTVGSIVALGSEKSTIKAVNVVNACLSAIIRKGEAHAKGRCGWGTGRHTWYADSYTAELVTQSHGSAMLFGGDLDIEGHTENIGSKLLSKGLFRGQVNSRSVLENIAEHGTNGMFIEDTFSNYESPLLFVHIDRSESSDAD